MLRKFLLKVSLYSNRNFIDVIENFVGCFTSNQNPGDAYARISYITVISFYDISNLVTIK